MQKSPLQQEYEDQIREELFEERGYDNIMQVPDLDKIVVNAAVGEGSEEPEKAESAAETITQITGRRSMITRAKKSIANFEVRQGDPVGTKADLRGNLMWHFLYKTIHVALPRVRDFEGLSVESFDGSGNYNIGFEDQLPYPEIDFDEADFMHGLQVTIVTTADDDVEAAYLLSKLGMPFNDFTPAETVA